MLVSFAFNASYICYRVYIVTLNGIKVVFLGITLL